MIKFFYHDYLLLKNDVPPLVIWDAWVPELNFSLLHQSGHYIVAVLKEGMPSTTATAPSMSSRYKTTGATEGPCVCTFSTLTGEWRSRCVSLPGDLTSWNWHIHTMLANGDSSWWVDLCCGSLSCDPDQHQSAFGFIPLPPPACFEDGIDFNIR